MKLKKAFNIEKCKFFADFFDVFMTKTRFYLVYEFQQCDSLRQYLKLNKKFMDEDKIFSIVYKIYNALKGLTAVEGYKKHGNLKLSNVFYNEEY